MCSDEKKPSSTTNWFYLVIDLIMLTIKSAILVYGEQYAKLLFNVKYYYIVNVSELVIWNFEAFEN